MLRSLSRAVSWCAGHHVAPSACSVKFAGLHSSSASSASSGGGGGDDVTTADVIVIGAGIIGSSLTMELCRKGYTVLNIDRGPGPGTGSTSFSAGINRTFYSALQPCLMAYEGFHVYSNWEEHLRSHGAPEDPDGYAKLRVTGGCVIRSDTAESFFQNTTACHEELGIPYEVWDTATLEQNLQCSTTSYGPPRRIDDPEFGSPAMDGDKEREITGCAYFPNTGYVSDPMLATRNVHFAAKHTGKATFRFGKRGDVMSIEYDSSAGRVGGVTLADGSKLSAPVVVNCGGPYSSRITDLAFPEAETAAGRRPGNDMAFTTRALRVEVAAVDAPDNDTYKDAEGSFGPVVTDFDVGTYWRAELGNKIMIGSVEPACDPLHFQDNPDEMPEALTEDHTALIYRCALRLPQLGLGSGTSTQGFAAMYDATPDWTPLYDKSSMAGYYMAIGTSGNQFKNGPVAARFMSELIDRTESAAGAFDHDATPHQHQLQWVKGELDISAFTRLRDTSASATSGSVLG